MVIPSIFYKMLINGLTRLFRSNIFLIFLSILTFVYFLANLFGKLGNFRLAKYEDEIIHRTRPVIWRSIQEHVLPEDKKKLFINDPSKHCRNSMQGSEILVDDRGFVCARALLLSNGCCNIETQEIYYYSCNTCNDTTHCCRIYEYCVSCCLHPSKRPLLELVMRTITGRQAVVYTAVQDQFELCLVKCRTNSHSVMHENKYRDPIAKYCYGQTFAHESEREVSGIIIN